MKDKKIVIISGGISLERKIALKSSEMFKKHFSQDFDYYTFPEEMEAFLKNKNKYKLAVPIFHGEYGEDGKIFAFLEILGMPHTFSKYDVHALCLNKEKSNILVDSIGIKIPFQYIVKSSNDFPQKYPVIMKPNNGGSSFHTYKINSNIEFSEKYNKTRKDIEDDILIQEFVSGEEYSVPIVNGEVLPIMKLEKDTNDIFDYDSKYNNDEIIKETFPEIEIKLKDELTNTTKKIYKYFDLKGMSRIDYLVKNNEIFFLEVNTIPGMTEVSILPQAWKLTGRNLTELVDEVIKI